MKIIGLIPARKGSVTIKNKNIVPFHGKPLIQWSIDSIQESKLINNNFVSTDSEVVKRIANKSAIGIINRPQYLANNTATTLSVLKHAVKFTNADVIVLLQATSPFRKSGIVDLCLKKFLKSKADSLATGTFLTLAPWGKYNNLPKEKLKKWFFDDGSIYILSAKDILKDKWTGRKKEYFIVEKQYAQEIDDLYDLELNKFLMKKYKK